MMENMSNGMTSNTWHPFAPNKPVVVVVCVRKLVFGHVGYVVAQKQAPHRVLDTLGHLHDIFQDFFGRHILGLNVNGTSCD